jgi:hypothetical protein
MARFMADIAGQAGPSSRLGNVGSGIRSHTRGWNLGIKVHGDASGDKDVFVVEVTGGSHNASRTRRVITVWETDEGTIKIEYGPYPEGNMAFEIYDRDLTPLVVGIH